MLMHEERGERTSTALVTELGVRVARQRTLHRKLRLCQLSALAQPRDDGVKAQAGRLTPAGLQAHGRGQPRTQGERGELRDGGRIRADAPGGVQRLEAIGGWLAEAAVAEHL